MRLDVEQQKRGGPLASAAVWSRRPAATLRPLESSRAFGGWTPQDPASEGTPRSPASHPESEATSSLINASVHGCCWDAEFYAPETSWGPEIVILRRSTRRGSTPTKLACGVTPLPFATVEDDRFAARASQLQNSSSYRPRRERATMKRNTC